MQDFSNKVSGSSYTAAEFNQFANELENIITTSGQSLSSGNLNQVGIAAAIYASGSDFYTEGGAANAYVCSVVGTKKAPNAYFNGMKVSFVVSATNTGASTINVDSIGAANIKDLAGNALSGYELIAGDLVTLIYQTSVSAFIIVNSTKKIPKIVSKSADFIITDNDQIELVIASGAGTDITLPTPADNINRIVTIVRNDASNQINIIRDNSSDTINGVADDLIMNFNYQVEKLLFVSANTILKL